MAWISVKEMLPKIGERVIVAHPVKGAFGACRIASGDAWYGRDEKVHYFITHWQPFPEPPKETISSSGLQCPHCKGALRLERYASYFAPLAAKVCPHCGKVMEIGLRLVKADG